jgi:hypothetical protein
MEKKNTSRDHILADLERASWESYIRSKSGAEADSRTPLVTQSNAVTEAAAKIEEIEERVDQLASDYQSLTPDNPRRAEIANEISRLRLLRANLIRPTATDS